MIYEYTNGIYPRRLIITDKFSYAERNYVYPEGDKLTVNKGANAIVYLANHKKLHRGDIVLVIHKPKEINTGIIAHESFHIAKAILEWLPITLSSHTEEAWAYVIEWAGNCFQDFMNKLNKK